MQQKQLSGIFYAAFASLWWGVVGTIFFKFVSFASFIELTVHRTIWTAVLLILTTSFYKKWPEFTKIFKQRKNQLLLFLSGLLVSINWGTWLYAVSVNRLLDSSLIPLNLTVLTPALRSSIILKLLLGLLTNIFRPASFSAFPPPSLPLCLLQLLPILSENMQKWPRFCVLFGAASGY